MLVFLKADPASNAVVRASFTSDYQRNLNKSGNIRVELIRTDSSNFFGADFRSLARRSRPVQKHRSAISQASPSLNGGVGVGGRRQLLLPHQCNNVGAATRSEKRRREL